MVYADNYREHFGSIHWTMPFDDPDMIALGQSEWRNVTVIPNLFQNGQSLWSVKYDGKINVTFATDGTVPDTALNVSVTNEQGSVIAQGVLSPETSMEQSAGDDSYYLWDTVLDPIPGNELQLLDTVTVTLTDQNSGEIVYKRSVRLASKD